MTSNNKTNPWTLKNWEEMQKSQNKHRTEDTEPKSNNDGSITNQQYDRGRQIGRAIWGLAGTKGR